MALKGTGLDTDNDGVNRAKPLQTPRIAGIKKYAKSDRDTAIGYTRDISAEIDRAAKQRS